MRRVILESPFGNRDPAIVEENKRYARLCVHDCLVHGDAPIASHLLYTQPGVLDDAIPEERSLGIEAGLAWGVVAEATVVYTDRGISVGMKYGIERAEKEGRPVEKRTLPGYAEKFNV
jgi:hypothetical protein